MITDLVFGLVVELADTLDLGSGAIRASEFDSRRGHINIGHNFVCGQEE